MNHVYHDAAVCLMAGQPKCKTDNARRILILLCAMGGWSAATDARSEQNTDIETRPAAINACALLSPAAISEATGFPADAGARRDSGYESNGSYSSTCVWMLEREISSFDRRAALGGRSFVILNVMRWPKDSGLADTFLRAFHDAAATGEIPNEPTSRDFGDAALWWGDGLAVRKGDVSFGISVVIPGVHADHPGEIEGRLAPEILRNLEHPAE